MKIGFEAKRAFHNYRGLGNYSRNLIDGLINYGPIENRYHLFTPGNFKPEFKNWSEQLDSKKVEIHTPQSFLNKQLPSLWRSRFCLTDIKKLSLDVFHGLSHELPYGIHKLETLKVLTVHDLLFIRYPHFFNFIDRFNYYLKLKYSLMAADIIIAICEQTKKDIIEYFKIDEKKIKVVYQSAHPRFYDKWSSAQLLDIKNKYQLPNHFVLYVGALEPNKNVLNLLKAFSIVAPDILDLHLVLVGQGKKYKETLVSFVEQNQLKDRVHFISKAESRDLPGIYQQSSLFVFPSLFEGFGIPIIEALFSQTPVIVTEGGVFPEVGGDAVIYADTKHPESIANNIKLVCESKDLKDEMNEKGLLWVQKFKQENSAAHLIDALKI